MHIRLFFSFTFMSHKQFFEPPPCSSASVPRLSLFDARAALWISRAQIYLMHPRVALLGGEKKNLFWEMRALAKL